MCKFLVYFRGKFDSPSLIFHYCQHKTVGKNISVLRFKKFASIFPNFRKISFLNWGPNFSGFNVVFTSKFLYPFQNKTHYLYPVTLRGHPFHDFIIRF